jgi:GH15 family glucan-1,4-alpha-glucosidase
MEPDMKESGVIIKQTVKESFGMLMEIFTKENGRMIKQMDLVFTLTKMEQDMKVIGLTIYNMVLE